MAGNIRPPRRARLRTRVLAGVVLIMLIILAAFDVAVVGALRGYLMYQTDVKLRGVLAEAQMAGISEKAVRAALAGQSRKPGRQPSAGDSPAPPTIGPSALSPATLAQYFVGAVVSGHTVTLGGDPTLQPRLPPDPITLTRRQRPVTLPGRDGQGQVRFLAGLQETGIVYVTTSLAPVTTTLDRLELILGVGSAAAGLLAAGGIAWVMRRGLRPIETMAGEADAIAPESLTARVTDHDPRTEVGRLSAAINDMLARIQAFAREREATQEATRQFLADASHELRTPLAALRANAELYQQGALPERHQVDEAMRRITLEARRMGRLVDDMLRLARLDQHPAAEHELVDLSALTAECVQRARTADPERGWHSDIAAGLEVRGDEELLRRAIDNVLVNVTAHAPDGTSAAIEVTQRAGSVVVSVSDDGPGVARSELPRVFDRFYRAGPAAADPGSGLGLAIVSAIMTAHGGSVDAAPNQPHGLRVTLTVPGL